MQHFLEAYWKAGGGHGKSKPGETTDLAPLLGCISLLSDGGTADPAQLQDWLRTADSVIYGGVGPLMLTFGKLQE